MIRENTPDDEPPWASAVRDLWRRTTGGRHELRLTRTTGGGRRHETQASDGRLEISASDASAASRAIHSYLRRACGRRVTWGGEWPLPTSAPDHERFAENARVGDLYYLNFCSHAYTTAHWEWSEWEREIDWMALHGVTMPLVLPGHEAVLATVFARHGMSDDAIRRFLGAPVYLPFVYMGCLDSFGGPLPKDWIAERLALARQILARQRGLGMKPVLPAFTGHVPSEIGGRAAERWQGFTTSVLDPADPLFAQLTAEIVETQRELLGTDHLYAADPFIEMAPADDPGRATAVAAAIASGLRRGDPQAVWVLQSWPFSYSPEHWTPDRIEAFLDPIPRDGLLLLDLWAEARPLWDLLAPAGRDWAWCALGNFGGRVDFIGALPAIVSEAERALASPTPPIALGMSMEAIHVQPATFELTADLAWEKVDDLDEWLREFGPARYGLPVGSAAARAAAEAWTTLGSGPLSGAPEAIFPEYFISVLATRPTLDPPHSLPWDIEAARHYPLTSLADAADHLLAAVDETPSPALLDDIAVTVITLAVRVADLLFADLAAMPDPSANLDASGLISAILTAIAQIDRVAAARPSLRLESWVADARRHGADEAEKAALDRSARRLVTTWTEDDSPTLDNYSVRLWSGIAEGYLAPRWRAFFELAPSSADPMARAAQSLELDRRLAGVAAEFVDVGPNPSPIAGMADIREALAWCRAKLADHPSERNEPDHV